MKEDKIIHGNQIFKSLCYFLPSDDIKLEIIIFMMLGRIRETFPAALKVLCGFIDAVWIMHHWLMSAVLIFERISHIEVYFIKFASTESLFQRKFYEN